MFRLPLLACCLTTFLVSFTRADDSLVKLVSRMDDPKGIDFVEGELKAVPEGAKGAMVLRSDRPFQSRIDFKDLKIDPRKYDLLKLQVKADARAMLQVSLENYPEPGLMSHWYLFGKTRDAFALVGGHVLVLDRVQSDKPRTIDWCLRYRGDSQTYKDMADGMSLSLEHRKGSFTDKVAEKARGIQFGAELRSEGHYVATSSETWRQKQGAMVAAKGDNTKVMVFAVGASFSATQKERVNGVPVLMARRENVKQTDWRVAFSKEIKEIKQRVVSRADGKEANAIGVEILLNNGKTFQAIANFEAEGVEVRLGTLKTLKRFATDH